MLDPLTALGLAGNIVQFVDFGVKVLKDAHEIYTSTTGAIEDNKVRESITSEMKTIVSKLSVPRSSSQSEEEKALCRLAAECEKVSKEILELLDKLKPKKPGSKFQSLKAALKTKIKEEDIAALEKTLGKYSSQIQLFMRFDPLSPCNA